MKSDQLMHKLIPCGIKPKFVKTKKGTDLCDQSL